MPIQNDTVMYFSDAFLCFPGFANTFEEKTRKKRRKDRNFPLPLG